MVPIKMVAMVPSARNKITKQIDVAWLLGLQKLFCSSGRVPTGILETGRHYGCRNVLSRTFERNVASIERARHLEQ